MPSARPVVEGATLFITRYVLRGEFRLSPVPEAVQIIGYLLAVLAKRHGIKLNAVCVMSNHWHALLKDVFASCPAFTRDFHSQVTRQLNFAFNESGQLWDQRQTSYVRPIDAIDILDRFAYTMANPVHHAAVLCGDEWPGLRRSWPDPPLRFDRPDGLFDTEARNKDGSLKWPPYADLEMHRPDGFDGESDKDLAKILRASISDREEEERLKIGDTLPPGRAAILKQERDARPAEPRKPGERNPTIACKDKTKRRLYRAAQRAWRAEYKRCLDEWRAGNRDVVFPPGTYKMRLVHGANVAPPPT